MYIEINQDIHNDISETNYLSNEKPLEYFGELSNVNLLIGPNNSGKSRFIRGLIKTEKTRIVQKKGSILWEKKFFENLDKLSKNLKSNQRIEYHINPNYSSPKFLNKSHESVYNNLESTRQFILEKKTILELKENLIPKLHDEKIKSEDLLEQLLNFYYKVDITKAIIENKDPRKFSQIVNSKSLILSRESSINHKDKNAIVSVLSELKIYLEQFKELQIQTVTPGKIYISTLRNAATLYWYTNPNPVLVPANRAIFKESIIKNYGLSKDEEKLKIITGLDLYDSIRLIRNNVKSVRKDFEKFEEFLSKVFFNGDDVDIVAKASENQEGKNIIVHIGGEERDIHHLGDGIQSLIILMYPIFTATEGSWIFIEEPEINLHPGLQRIFLEQLLTNEDFKKKNLKFFITTHSNHFLDLSLNKDSDISIFTFYKIKSEESISYEIKNVLSSDTNSLRILGVRNSSVFISNCTIWVEGICDRKYIKAFLKAFYNQFPNEKRFNEDVDFAFFEYAGSNLSHYIFENNEEELEKIKGQFLSNKIFLVADADEGKEQKHEYYKNQESDIFKYEVLNCKEIENILSKEQIISFLPDLIKGLKSENLETISLNKAHLKTQYLGSYLKKSLKGLSIPKAFTAESGTLTTYYKNKLADIVSDKMDWSEMTEYAKGLTTKIHSFILKSNS